MKLMKNKGIAVLLTFAMALTGVAIPTTGNKAKAEAKDWNEFRKQNMNPTKIITEKPTSTKAKKNTKTKDGNTLRKVRINETTVITELVLNDKHAKNYNMYREYRQMKNDLKNNPLDENATDAQKRMYDARLQVLSDLYKKNEAAMKDGRKYWNQANWNQAHGVTESVVTKNDKIDSNVFNRQMDQIAAHRITGDKTNATIRFNDFNIYLKKAAFSTTKVDFSTTAAEIDTYEVEYGHPYGDFVTPATTGIDDISVSKSKEAHNSYATFKKHTSDIKPQILTASSQNRTCMM